jgi:cytochrome P450
MFIAPFDPLTAQDPYETYRRLRAEEPLHRNDERDFWALSRFDDVQAAARDWRLLSSAAGVNLDDTLALTGAGNFIAADPPAHDRLRRVVRERFAPRAVPALAAAVRADVRHAISGWRRDGTIDVAAELAWALPVQVISRLLGLPTGDRPDLVRRLEAVIAREPGSDRVPSEAHAAATELHAYFERHAAARAARPRDDLLTDIVRARSAGEIAEGELAGLCTLLYVAGTETVGVFTPAPAGAARSGGSCP